MNRTLRLLVGLFLLVDALALQAAGPNVILILADDMAVGDLAAVNGGRTRTPTLDRLIEEGLWFERAYSASPVCAPARAALLTGRYPHRTGVVSLTMRREPELTRLKQDERTLADVFAANGYRTGLVGKWHTGLGAGYGPKARGFQEMACFVGLEGKGYFDYVLHADDDMRGKAKPQDIYLTDALNEQAIAFVRRNADRPFFLHLAHHAPHRPLEAPEEAIEPYLRAGFERAEATVYAMVEIMDRGLGRLVEELDTLGLRERTVIFFASDNGPDIQVPKRFNAGLRGGKYMVYEGGVRVPFVVNWPGTVRPGRSTEMVHFTDVLPTLVELCGLKHTPHLPLDGVSFAPLLIGRDGRKPRPLFWQWNRHEPDYTHNAAVRIGPWKLVKPYVTSGTPKGRSDLPYALYDMDEDPGETNDLAAREPERVESMRRALDRWTAEVERERLR